MKEERTAIVFGCQNCSPIENDIDLVQVCRQLGIRFMQLSYNNQSLLASGCYEAEDTGITRMGRQVIREMNRVGMAVDMSHSGEKSTLQAIELSERPVAITHANPARWHDAPRNKSDTVVKALAESGGMLGLSLYPHHLRNGSACSLASFCRMIAETVELTAALSGGSGLGRDIGGTPVETSVTGCSFAGFVCKGTRGGHCSTMLRQGQAPRPGRDTGIRIRAGDTNRCCTNGTVAGSVGGPGLPSRDGFRIQCP